MKLEMCDNKFFPWKKNTNIIFAFFALGRGGFLVSIGWRPGGEMHPLGLHFCLGIYQSVSDPLWAFPKSRQHLISSAQMVSKSF